MDTSPSHVGVELNVRALIKYMRDPKFNPQYKEKKQKPHPATPHWMLTGDWKIRSIIMRFLRWNSVLL